MVLFCRTAPKALRNARIDAERAFRNTRECGARGLQKRAQLRHERATSRSRRDPAGVPVNDVQSRAGAPRRSHGPCADDYAGSTRQADRLPSIASVREMERVELRRRLCGAIEAAAEFQNRLEMLKVADCANDPWLAEAS
jgi:hypothetical protein